MGVVMFALLLNALPFEGGDWRRPLDFSSRRWWKVRAPALAAAVRNSYHRCGWPLVQQCPVQPSYFTGHCLQVTLEVKLLLQALLQPDLHDRATLATFAASSWPRLALGEVASTLATPVRHAYSLSDMSVLEMASSHIPGSLPHAASWACLESSISAAQGSLMSDGEGEVSMERRAELHAERAAEMERARNALRWREATRGHDDSDAMCGCGELSTIPHVAFTQGTNDVMLQSLAYEGCMQDVGGCSQDTHASQADAAAFNGFVPSLSDDRVPVHVSGSLATSGASIAGSCATSLPPYSILPQLSSGALPLAPTRATPQPPTPPYAAKLHGAVDAATRVPQLAAAMSPFTAGWAPFGGPILGAEANGAVCLPPGFAPGDGAGAGDATLANTMCGTSCGVPGGAPCSSSVVEEQRQRLERLHASMQHAKLQHSRQAP